MPKKTFEEALYKRTSISDLILFGIRSVSQNKEKCSFERLTKECFSLFPKSFSLSDFPEWPDCRKLDRPLRYLRARKMLKGGPGSFFQLTLIGSKRVKDIIKALGQRQLEL